MKRQTSVICLSVTFKLSFMSFSHCFPLTCLLKYCKLFKLIEIWDNKCVELHRDSILTNKKTSQLFSPMFKLYVSFKRFKLTTFWGVFGGKKRIPERKRACSTPSKWDTIKCLIVKLQTIRRFYNQIFMSSFKHLKNLK